MKKKQIILCLIISIMSCIISGCSNGANSQQQQELCAYTGCNGSVYREHLCGEHYNVLLNDKSSNSIVERDTTMNTPKPTATDTPKPTATDTPKPTATDTPKPTATDTPKPTATDTPKPTATDTPKPTATNTPKPTNTPTPTATNTPKPTNTPTPTATNTPVPTATNTPTPKCDWEKIEKTDSFGDPTGIIYYQQLSEGTFSNNVTEGARLVAKVQYYPASHSFHFYFYEYGTVKFMDNRKKDPLNPFDTIRIKRPSGEKYEGKTGVWADLINPLTEVERKMEEWLLAGEELVCVVSWTGHTYSFTIDGTGLQGISGQ